MPTRTTMKRSTRSGEDIEELGALADALALRLWRISRGQVLPGGELLVRDGSETFKLLANQLNHRYYARPAFTLSSALDLASAAELSDEPAELDHQRATASKLFGALAERLDAVIAGESSSEETEALASLLASLGESAAHSHRRPLAGYYLAQ